MTQMTNKAYELMIILKPMLPEDIRSGIEKRLKGIIEKNSGKVLLSDVWGKKHLAYHINKHEEGYYIVYDIEMPADKLGEIEAEIKLISDILRYIIVRKDNQ